MSYGRAIIKVAAIIPAYNEEKRIGAVLDAVGQAGGLDEILVVDDGSTDRTLDMLPNNDGVRAVRLDQNLGKGGAMWAGVQATDADVIVFLDADLIGLRPEHVEMLTMPVINDEADMCIGVFQGGRYWTDMAQRIAPYISGQRALRREILLGVPEIRDTRSGVEVALTHHARINDWRVRRITLGGITHVMKEEKMGPLRGVAARAGMYWDIGRYVVSERCRHGARRVARSMRRLFGAEQA